MPCDNQLEVLANQHLFPLRSLQVLLRQDPVTFITTIAAVLVALQHPAPHIPDPTPRKPHRGAYRGTSLIRNSTPP